jgi:hypothetical protein
MAFEQNLESISQMIKAGKREMTLVKAAATRLHSFLPRDFKDKAAVEKLLRSVNRYRTTVSKYVELLGTLTLWQVVMLVTFVEAYLQDLLAAAASIDPDMMRESLQVAKYADIISATSLDELANDLRARWARNWSSDGGPTRWISRLKRMGAGGYPKNLASSLELIWGIRHVVVHAAGVASADFIKRHPGVPRQGERVRVPVGNLARFVRAVDSFLKPTEQFFLARYPSLDVSTSTKRPSTEVRNA